MQTAKLGGSSWQRLPILEPKPKFAFTSGKASFHWKHYRVDERPRLVSAVHSVCGTYCMTERSVEARGSCQWGPIAGDAEGTPYPQMSRWHQTLSVPSGKMHHGASERLNPAGISSGRGLARSPMSHARDALTGEIH